MSNFDDYVINMAAAARDAQKVAELICEHNSLVTLVEDMRKAQKAFENAPRETRYDLENIETLFLEAQELEKRVDRLIHNIRIKQNNIGYEKVQDTGNR